MIYSAIISAILVLGLAYIIWVLANKEEGGLKLAGQVLAVLVILVAVMVLYRGTMRRHYGMMGGDMKNIMMEMKHNMPASTEATKGTWHRGTMRHGK